ncbi:hypothetical protein IAT38_007762 [Cryptococcus sp. DSM 104549]
MPPFLNGPPPLPHPLHAHAPFAPPPPPIHTAPYVPQQQQQQYHHAPLRSPYSAYSHYPPASHAPPPPPHSHHHHAHHQHQHHHNTAYTFTPQHQAQGQPQPQGYGSRPAYAQPTPTRSYTSSRPSYPSQRSSSTYPAHAPQPNGTHSHSHSHSPAPRPAPPPPRQPLPTYNHPSTHSPGPLPFFLPPPGQRTTDPSLSTPPTTQALYSTYPARLRTGVTGMVQPEHVTGGPREREAFLAEMEREIGLAGMGGRSASGTATPRYDSPAPYTSSARRAPPSGFGGRRSRVVNYAEKASDDEDDEDEDDDDDVDDDDEDDGGRRRRGGGRRERDVFASGGVGPEHQAAMRAGKLRKKKEELERGWTWLGDRTPGERVTSRTVLPTKHTYQSEEQLEKEADRPEFLVPIAIDLDVPPYGNEPGIKLKDRFLWNVNEPFIEPHQFAGVFCDDIGISASYASTIAELIKTQLEEAQNAAEIDIMNEEVTEGDVVWTEEVTEAPGVREVQVNGQANGQVIGTAETPAVVVDGEGDEEKEAEVEEEADEEKAEAEERRVRKRRREEERDDTLWIEPDCRIIVNLDVQIYTHILRDRIEWDLSSSLPPSVFAKHYCAELGLTGEAIPTIAHAITEELLKHKRDALELELFARTHPEEQAKWDKAPGGQPRVNSRYGAKRLVGVWRDWWEREEFGPVMVELTMDEMERREVERTREARRMMRTLTTAKRRR